MRKTELVVFDLDGTLVQSHKTIYSTLQFTFDQLGIKTSAPEQQFMQLIGHHFKDIFSGLGVVVKDYDKFIEIYKSSYFNYIHESSLYDGVVSTLNKLKERGIKIALLTTKLQDQADAIIHHFELDEYFDIVMGRREGIAHKPAPEPLLLICGELNILQENTLMVGDTDMDILCGKNAGTGSCAVTFGYRSYGELIKFNPDYTINKFEEILNLIPG